MHCRIFKSKSKQKIIERIEVKETTMNTHGQTQTNRAKSMSLWIEIFHQATGLLATIWLRVGQLAEGYD